MAGNRRAGRNFAIYVAIASGGTPEPLFFLKTYDANFEADQIDVTASGDTNKTFVLGLPNAEMNFTGVWSDDSNDHFTAATDGLARKFYAYPDRLNKAGTYFYGQAFLTFKMSGDVSGATEMGGKMVASGNWTRIVG